MLNMEIGLVPIDGVLLGAVFVTKKEINEAPLCENCGERKVINHPTLNKREEDWCLQCNDEMLKRNLSDQEWSKWCLEQTMAGRTVMVVCTEHGRSKDDHTVGGGTHPQAGNQRYRTNHPIHQQELPMGCVKLPDRFDFGTKQEIRRYRFDENLSSQRAMGTESGVGN